MELKIGDNIKRLRQNKGITQQQLAELLNVSDAAVSKWENSNTYPDITMIIPLAQIFNVSIDELMGYNAFRVETEIEKIIADHRQLQIDGKYHEATVLISKARKSYPNDYRIMSCYMWDIAGGNADNKPEVLNHHQGEFLQICDCILTGCTDEKIRLETINMKAKLLYAAGNTSGALEILSQFPTWTQSSEQKTEQLFSKDTSEYRYWVRRNLYGLADITANKMIKTIWYEEGISVEDRITKCESIGDMFTDLRKQSEESVFAIYEHMIFAEFSGKLTFNYCNIEDIIRIQEKRLISASAVTYAARKDSILQELLIKTYKTDNLLQWTVTWLKNAPQTPMVRLRKSTEFLNMLEKY